MGHGSPMNAIRENTYVEGFRKIAGKLPKPRAILCISAHWETSGTRITGVDKPSTIHDFGGFPCELFEVTYPAPSNRDLALEIQSLLQKNGISAALDQRWGLDHGTWSVLRHLYPNADIPVIQLSLDYHKNTQQHYELAALLQPLRKKGVLIIGSGNMVHNLRKLSWKRIEEEFGFDWALAANEKIKKHILNGDHQSLINYVKQEKEIRLAIPRPDHFLPLLYVLALKEAGETVTFFNDRLVGGAMSMTSLKIS